MKIGVISDTHGFLDPKVSELFAGVSHILHGGDIGADGVIDQLQDIAPVTAVLGNTDVGLGLNHRETEVVELAGRKFVLHHIVNPYAPPERVQAIIERDCPAAVIFGHTHHAFSKTIWRVLFVNPGYAGKPKHGAERKVAILHCDENEIRPEFLNL
jgi:putative phosphoesterase